MEHALRELAAVSPLAKTLPATHPACHTPFGVLFDHVRISRNDAMHEGAFARHLTTHLAQLALVREDALMGHSRSVGDFIVRNPTCALRWQPVSFVRQVMLAESYSFLPVSPEGDEQWKVVVDRDLALFIQSAEDRQKALGMTLAQAITGGLSLREPYRCERKTEVAEALRNSHDLPVLVIEAGNLLGMATPFDLL